MDATRQQLSPMMYMQKFNCSPVQMGTYLAIGNACHVPANFLWGAAESFMITRCVQGSNTHAVLAILRPHDLPLKYGVCRPQMVP
eukprot:SAG22_NODE_1548_length_4150_cov_2.816095_6_plen_85_part_00